MICFDDRQNTVICLRLEGKGDDGSSSSSNGTPRTVLEVITQSAIDVLVEVDMSVDATWGYICSLGIYHLPSSKYALKSTDAQDLAVLYCDV